MQRTIDQGFFSKDEERELLRLQGPLSRAALFARDLGDVALEGAGAAFEALGQAWIALDRLGRVARISDGATRLLGHEISIRDGRLLIAHPAEHARYLRHIEAALWRETEPDSPDLAPVRVSRPGQRPLVLQAAPLHGEAFHAFAPARAILSVVDLDPGPQVSAATLRSLFDLSPAEARLASRIGQAGDLRRTAEALGIQYETARTLMKAILAKTQTSAQPELFALLERLSSRAPRPR